MTEETHKVFLEHVLNRLMNSEGVVGPQHAISHGKCHGSPDMWGDAFAKKFGLVNDSHPAKDYDFDYFYRNGIIADHADVLFAFIRRGQVKSGAWNTVSQFLDMGKTDVLVLDEFGEPWMQKWAQAKLDRNLASEAPLYMQTSLVS